MTDTKPFKLKVMFIVILIMSVALISGAVTSYLYVIEQDKADAADNASREANRRRELAEAASAQGTLEMRIAQDKFDAEQKKGSHDLAELRVALELEHEKVQYLQQEGQRKILGYGYPQLSGRINDHHIYLVSKGSEEGYPVRGVRLIILDALKLKQCPGEQKDVNHIEIGENCYKSATIYESPTFDVSGIYDTDLGFSRPFGNYFLQVELYTLDQVFRSYVIIAHNQVSGQIAMAIKTFELDPKTRVVEKLLTEVPAAPIPEKWFEEAFFFKQKITLNSLK